MWKPLLGGLIELTGTLVGRAMLFLGLSFVTYQGFDTFLQSAQADIWANFGQMPADVLGLLGVLKVDLDVSILISAVTTRLVLKGMQSGLMRQIVGR